MGSKKKRQESDSSSSSSDLESSDSSAEKQTKRQRKKNRGSTSDSETVRKSKNDEERGKQHRDRGRREEVEKEDTQRKRRRTPSPPNRDSQKKDERRTRDDRVKYEERRRGPNDYNNRSHGDRHRNRRPNYRDRRDDRERDYRGRKDDNRDHFNWDRDRNRRRSRSASFDHKNARWGRNDDKKPEENEPKEKQKPNFGLSGKLTEERNTYRGVVIKYSEPPEAAKPKRRWRLYPFKGDKALQPLYIHRESAYLIGRDRKVVDFPVDHPSCSKQHAALQYRLVTYSREDGTSGKRVRPYLIDLNSANGTFINNKKVEASKYVELLEKDVIKFAFSSREYVLLHENSKDEHEDDDVKEKVEKEEKTEVKNEEN